MRAFIGIKLDDCTANIVDIIEELKLKDSRANYTLINNIHITIEFLGEISEADILKVKDIFNSLDQPSFEVELNKITKLRDMIILATSKNRFLNSLNGFINSKLIDNGFTLQNRRFYPHVTIARKSSLDIEHTISLKSIVKEVILFSSSKIDDQLFYAPIITKQLK